MRPMAVTRVAKFMKCVEEINELILWRVGYQILKVVNTIKRIVIDFLEGAQDRANI